MAANVNNYISAGNAAVRKAVKARKALADNKARLDEIGMQAVTEAARNAGNVAKNNALTAQATMDAKRYVKETELELEADKAEYNAKKTARKAGLLGAGVGMLAVGAARMNKKEEPNEMLALLQKQQGVYAKRAADARKEVSDIESETYPGLSVDSNSGTQPTDTVKPDIETAPVPQGDTSIGSSTPTKSNSGGSGSSPTFQGIVEMAKQSGAAHPQLVAAQWALESGYGKTPSGKNNFFGIKATSGESSSSKPTWEVINGQKVNTTADFKNFDTPQAAVDDLVNKWYKDFKGYSGVNRAGSAREAADLLVTENYATDPEYARKLKDILADNGY